MREAEFSKQRKKQFEECGAEVFVCTGSFYQGSGWPDWQINHVLFRGWIELKVGSNRCKGIQQIRIKRLRERGTAAFVYRWKEGRETLEDEVRNVYCELTGTPMQKLTQIQKVWSDIRSAAGNTALGLSVD